MPETVVVVGGGLVGGLAGLAMGKLGYKVKIIERRDSLIGPEMESNGKDKSVSKRSINLALSHRGIEALKRVGLHETAMTMCIPMFGRAIHIGEKLLFQPYDEIDPKNHINSISRENLNRLLLQTAERQPNVEVIYGKQLTHIDKKNVLHFTDTAKGNGGTYNDMGPGEYRIEDASLILGCDGAYSAVRESMFRLQSTNFKRQYITHGYKELEIRPDALSGDYQLKPPHALHIWPRDEFMMIALPNLDRSFTCTIFAPLEELSTLTEDEDIRAYFERNFPSAIQYMPDYLEQFKANPACRLVTAVVDPWNVNDKIVLLGDAAHACVPFYGQGMNSGMEDALELVETIEANKYDLSKAVPEFSKRRMPRGNAIVDLSLRNYLEMRSHTASRMFLFRKKIEGFLNWIFPTTWVPLYKMVAFTRIPYDEAIRREQTQDRIIRLVSSAAIAGVAVSLGAVSLLFASKFNYHRSNRLA